MEFSHSYSPCRVLTRSYSARAPQRVRHEEKNDRDEQTLTPTLALFGLEDTADAGMFRRSFEFSFPVSLADDDSSQALSYLLHSCSTTLYTPECSM